MTIRRYSYQSNQIITRSTRDVSRDFGGSTPDAVYESSRIATFDVTAASSFTDRATDLPEVGSGSVVDLGGGVVTWNEGSWFTFSVSGEKINEQSGEAAMAVAPALASKDPRPASADRNGSGCAQLFGAEMTATLVGTGFALDQVVSADDVGIGLEDEALQTIAAVHGSDLTCRWRTSSIHYGITTRVMELSTSEASLVASALSSSGMQSEELLGGNRFFATDVIPAAESVDGVDGETGRSHYLRGTTWIATTWSGPAPSGYTRDIVEHLAD
ncbi:hypothetical protein [Rathayibacter sp. VKM Ac-2760]|uniref:hypothetical protein n=1 Tax=Rathayibacter sp. VKM Ac-2760 TaxID=2609253 RepID=UPI00131996A9|nr:hypothetical protein [Rathayibacter sp. VKM Ac-2760]QHC57541.1 hypothetical protein GSU72_02285 [Rathayibacter sp. VKM Ac-2760]